MEDLINPAIFRDAPELSVFQDRQPDSGEAPVDRPEGWSVLGTYQHMGSPGLITLYRHNIEAYWKSLLRHAHRQFPFITVKDAERVLQLLSDSVYQHERFHYICDFTRRLLGATFDRWHEESLAVAYEWHWQKNLAWNSFFELMHPTLRRIVVQQLFNHTVRGYRDWRNYAIRADFHAAVYSYLYPNPSPSLAGTPFNFAKWVLDHGADDGNKGWDEQIA